jgi:hypothetical protein
VTKRKDESGRAGGSELTMGSLSSATWPLAIASTLITAALELKTRSSD